jgi:hypothetical protein
MASLKARAPTRRASVLSQTQAPELHGFQARAFPGAGDVGAVELGGFRKQQFAHEVFEAEDAANDGAAQIAREQREGGDRCWRADGFDGAREAGACALPEWFGDGG